MKHWVLVQGGWRSILNNQYSYFLPQLKLGKCEFPQEKSLGRCDIPSHPALLSYSKSAYWRICNPLFSTKHLEVVAHIHFLHFSFPIYCRSIVVIASATPTVDTEWNGCSGCPAYAPCLLFHWTPDCLVPVPAFICWGLSFTLLPKQWAGNVSEFMPSRVVLSQWPERISI